MAPGSAARRRLLVALGLSLVALFVVIELLLFRSYQETESTTRDFLVTTDTTTSIANVQREALLLDKEVSGLPAGKGRREALSGVELRRGLLARQLEVLNGQATGLRGLQHRIAVMRTTLARFGRAFAAGSGDARVGRSLRRLELQVKEIFDDSEHALYAALTQTLHQRANSQRFVVGLSALALLLVLALATGIWRAVRGNFARAYAALSAEAAEREVLQEKLQHQATHDPLTGLANRVEFQCLLEAVLPDLGSRLAVLYVDLDGFKSVNDTLGHDAGDDLLREIARRLATCVRPTDRLARLGGDEFAVLLHEVVGEDQALETAERLRAAVGAPWQLRGRTIRVGACIGVSLSAAHDGDADELIASADLAMYAAKHAGKGAVRIHDAAMRTEALEQAELEMELRGAIEAGELELHYQPIVDLSTESLLGLEALIRWRHPRLGLLSPAVFLPLAEEAHLMVPIGRWVLEQACRDAGGWPALTAGREPPWVSVNIAPAQIEDPSLFDDVARALRHNALDAGRLLLEISERTALDSGPHPGAVLAGLREQGVRIALDDFGTGHTPLSSLRFLALDVLKLDKSFIDDVATDTERKRTAGAVLELADTLGLETVAEGIEESDQVTALLGLGCRMGQGFLFSRPVPPDQVPALLAQAPSPALAASSS